MQSLKTFLFTFKASLACARAIRLKIVLSHSPKDSVIFQFQETFKNGKFICQCWRFRALNNYRFTFFLYDFSFYIATFIIYGLRIK